MNDKVPKVGLAMIILKRKEVLLGQRLSSLGYGTWGFPGGKVDYFENSGKCGLREVKEETGIGIKLLNHSPVETTEDFFHREGLHYVTLYMRAAYISGTPRVMEPDKCRTWAWFDWNHLPDPLFLPVKNLIKKGYDPIEDRISHDNKILGRKVSS